MSTQNDDINVTRIKKPMVPPTPEQIKKLRKSIHITQQEASNLLHVSASSYYRWENGVIEMPYGYWELFFIKALIAKDEVKV